MNSSRTIQVLTVIAVITVSLILVPLPAKAAPTGQYFDHVVFIAMENQYYSDVMGTGTGSSNAPFIASLLPYGATIPNYHGYGADGRSISGCSAGCYTALVSGSSQSISDGYSCCVNAPTIMDSLNKAGLTWQAYCEAGCPRGNDHFPFTGFASTVNSPNINTGSSVSTATFIAAANAANPPSFLWYTPTDSHNMHDVSIPTGDAYLQTFLVGTGSIASPASGSLLASSIFQPGHRTLLVLWWDEYDPSPILFYGPGVIKSSLISSSTHFDHYSTLRMLEDNWGVSCIVAVNDCAAPTMISFFGNNMSQFDCTNWACSNFVSPSTLAIAANGTAEIRQSNPNVCDWVNSYYDSLIRGTPPPAQGPSQGTALPSNIGSVSVSVSFLSRNLGPACNGSSGQGPRYHFFMSLYFKLGSPVSACGIYSGMSWLDTQVRLENINGVDSAIGTTSTYGGGSDPAVGACGWSTVALQLTVGSNGVLVANVANQCAQAEAAWGISTSNTCTLTGIEIGSEGYDFAVLNTNWYSVAFTSLPQNIPPSLSVPGAQTAAVGVTLVFSVSASDPDPGETLTLGASGLPSGASFDPPTGRFFWTPVSSQIGAHNVTFTVTDNGAPPLSDTKAVVIEVQSTPPTPPPSQPPGGQYPCGLCQVIPSLTTMWLLVTGGLLGFIMIAGVAYLRARARLAKARRMRR